MACSSPTSSACPRIFRAGVATYEFWLKLGIVLLGVRFLLGDVLRLGGTSLVLVALELAMSILIMTWLGTKFGLRPKLISLLAIGTSICGVSAIIAARGAIRAEDEDVSLAIAAILLLGGVSLVVFPVIGHLTGMGDQAYGLWVGLAIDNTAEATAAGAMFSDEAARYAVLAKTTRNATIGFVVLGYALYWAARGQGGERIGNKAAFLWAKFPKFVLGFLAVSLLATLAGGVQQSGYPPVAGRPLFAGQQVQHGRLVRPQLRQQVGRRLRPSQSQPARVRSHCEADRPRLGQDGCRAHSVASQGAGVR